MDSSMPVQQNTGKSKVSRGRVKTFRDKVVVQSVLPKVGNMRHSVASACDTFLIGTLGWFLKCVSRGNIEAEELSS